MAYIEACSVNGLAAQVSRNITFKRDVNVFYGGNGSGKTSLLRVLHSALSNDLDEIKRIALRSAEVEIADAMLEDDEPWYMPTTVMRRTPSEYPLFPEKGDASLTFGRRKPRKESKQWDSIADREGKNVAFRHIFLPISRLYFNEEATSSPEPLFGYNKQQTEADLDKAFAATVNFLWLRHTRNTGIEVQIAQANGLREILYDFLVPEENFETELSQVAISNPSQAYERLLNFLDRQSRFDRQLLDEASFTERMLNEPRLRKVVHDVETVEERVEAIRRPRNELDRILNQMIGGGKKISLEGDIKAFGPERETINLEDLSSGEKQLLRIFIDVLVADGQPILIDEPELSLHIDWQRRLLGILRRLAPNSQIIVATHSPEIMADVPDNRIIEL